MKTTNEEIQAHVSSYLSIKETLDDLDEQITELPEPPTHCESIDEYYTYAAIIADNNTLVEKYTNQDTALWGEIRWLMASLPENVWFKVGEHAVRVNVIENNQHEVIIWELKNDNDFRKLSTDPIEIDTENLTRG